MSTKFKRFLSLSLFAVAISACDQQSSEPVDAPSSGAGGKADDANGSCESAVCLESFEECVIQDGVETQCLIMHAECLAVTEGLPVFECTSFDGATREVCQSCENLPECEVVEDGADFNLCNAATAACQWERLGVMPNNCEPPQTDGPSCDSVDCLDAFDECLVHDGDENYCIGQHAECLAVTEGFEVADCDGFSGALNETCRSCENLPECEEVEDGADYNGCQAATASCQWFNVGILPGGCEPPETDAAATCVSTAGFTYTEGSCTNSYQCMPGSPDANIDGWIPRADDASCTCEDRWDSAGGCP